MRILVFHRGGHSGSVAALLTAWRSADPDDDIVECDLNKAVFQGVTRKLALLPKAMRKAGIRVLRRGNGALIDAVKHSVKISRRMSEIAKKIQAQEEADCSLCMATTVDAAVPYRPHFIYTDLTILANLQYPEGLQGVANWGGWLPQEIRILREATLIFVRSEHVRRSLCNQYLVPQNRVVRVNAGTNTSVLSEPSSERFKNKCVLFVGVEWSRKGGPQLLEAFARVKRQVPEASLTIVGCRPDVSCPGVHVVGPVPRGQMPHYFAEASVFCLPSRREAFGFSYIEAMQAGLPVIATHLGAAPDFVVDGATGYLVSPDDISTMSHRLVALLENPELCRRLGDNGRQLVARDYTWSRTQALIRHAMRNAVTFSRRKAP